MSTTVKQWPAGCGYQGYEYGAAYADSLCLGGWLFDADNCAGAGSLYEPTEDIPCPMCHPRKAVDWWTERNRNSGASSAKARDAAKKLVDDIRRNRKNGTEPWSRAARTEHE